VTIEASLPPTAPPWAGGVKEEPVVAFRMTRGWGALLAVAVLPLAIFGGGTGRPIGRSVNGPILAVITAASVDAAGQPTDITQFFSPTQPQVTALIVVGRIRAATELTVTWSQRTAHRWTTLFRVQITVHDFDLATSTALSRGTLASGVYRVAASIDHTTRSTIWVVTPPLGRSEVPSTTIPGATTSTPTASPASPDVFVAAADQTAPQPADENAGPTTVVPPPSPPVTGCREDTALAQMSDPNTVTVFETFVCPKSQPGKTNGADELATMNGSFHLVDRLVSTPYGASDLIGGLVDIDPCALPGGSDLPGARLTYKTVIDDDPEATTNEYLHRYLLPDDQAAPLLSGGSTPPHGTKVRPGQIIKVHITAAEPSDLGPQVGIQDIQLLGPEGLVGSATYGHHPTACDKSRLTKTLNTTYTVPDNPPPIITLTAIAHDFVNNESATLSADFPTGDEWKGTSTTQVDVSGCTSTQIETIDFVVAGSGAVSGTSQATVNIADSCGTYHPFTIGPLPISGTLHDHAFTFAHLLSLPGYGGPVSVPLVSAISASAHLTWSGPGFGPDTSNITLNCTTC
jgi:hypothetical protein